MEAQLAEFRNKGMMQDASISKSSNEFAFKNVNIRITAVNDNTLFSVTNEKGSEGVDIKKTEVAIPNKITFVEEAHIGQDISWKAVSQYPVASDIEIEFDHHGTLETYYFYINEGESESNVIEAWDADYPSYQNTQIDITEDDSYTYYVYGDDVPEERKVIVDQTIEGTYIGKCIIGNYLILFTKETGDDRIYRCSILDNGNLLADCIVDRDLGFAGPVETVGYYEREDIQKVYWVDGTNPNRVINIVAESQPDSFDFNPEIGDIPTISVSKQYVGAGSFPGGTIQYFVSYYNELGQETKIANATSLYYITDSNKGVKPGDTATCSFNITLSGLNTSFEYVRVYSAIRSTLDGPIDARIVGDYAIPASGTIFLTDTGRNEEAVDSSVLYYIGGDRFIASTIEDKDNVLFFGDLSIDNIVLLDEDIQNIQKDLYNKIPSKLYIKTEIRPRPAGGGTFTFTYIESEFHVDNDVEIRLVNPSDSSDYHDFVILNGNNESERTIGSFTTFDIEIITGAKALDFYQEGEDTPTTKSITFDYVNTGVKTSSAAYEENLILDAGSNKIKHFKCGNYYRFAIQLINSFGQYTDAIDIGIVKVSIAPSEIENGNIYVPKARFFWPELQYSQEVLSRFSHYRILMAETNDGSRVVSCQGIINPTVFMLGDRMSGNGPYAIPSWITRPQNTPNSMHLEILGGHDFEVNDIPLIGQFRTIKSFQPERNHEISSITNILPPFDGSSPSDLSYYVDSSILTLNSPDLNNMNLDELKLKIVGIARNSYSYSDFQIQYNNTGYEKTVGLTATSKNMLQLEEYYKPTKSTAGTNIYKFNNFAVGAELPIEQEVIDTSNLWYAKYPIISIWNGSDWITKSNYSATTALKYTSKYTSKLFSSYKYCDRTVYFANSDSETCSNCIMSKYNGESTLLKIGSKYISGNYDNLITPTLSYNRYYTRYDTAPFDGSFTIPASLASFSKHSFVWLGGSDNYTYAFSDSDANPIRIRAKYTDFVAIDLNGSILPAIRGNRTQYGGCDIIAPWDPLIYGSDFGGSVKKAWDVNSDVRESQQFLQQNVWNYGSANNVDSLMNIGLYNDDGEMSTSAYLFIADIYKNIDNPLNLYGNVENIKWINCGPIHSINQNTAASETEGDTFFQRWECLRTFPYAEGDENSVVDIVSFMVETYQNLDARYDSNRGYGNMNNARPQNFGLLNPAYNQANNIFKYNTIEERLQYQNFPQQFAWSLNKSAVSEIDAWTSATLSNIYNVDGSYGPINAIEKLNDTLIGFQDRAIFVINFNNRTQISTEQGLPIELANSGKVDGITYLTRHYGCKNKYSIVSTKTGLYFIDDENRAFINISKDGIADITASSGMSVWFEKQTSYNKKWNGGDLAAQSNYSAFVVGYDSNRGDIYIMNGVNSDAGCLVYNEILKTFTSFFDVSTTGYKFPLMYNFNGETYGLNGADNSFNKLFGGTYNSNYSVEYRVNPEPLVGKIFTNIDYIADVYDTEKSVDDAMSLANISALQPFDEISVFNEYQQKINVPLTENKWLQPTNATMFRIRHAQIPSTGTYGIDRMHNPWIHLKLDGNAKNALMQFHSLTVKYFK